MNWKVPFVDYSSQFKRVERPVMRIIRSVLSQGDLILRSQLEKFEKNFADYTGCRYAVGTASGTDALSLSLKALGVGVGDEVITVSHTFVATISAIRQTGATPVLVDTGKDHLISPEKIEKAIGPRTKAILPVHLFGRLCDMRAIGRIARKRRIFIIEDAAQALGASLGGRMAGAWGDAGCFSFYPAKLLGSYGEGGMIATNQKSLAQKLKYFRNHGRTREGKLKCWGTNSRMHNLQAAVLDFKLKKIPQIIRTRTRMTKKYQVLLKDCNDIKLPPFSVENESREDSCQNFVVLANRKNRLQKFLSDKGIETMIPWAGKAIHQNKGLGYGSCHLPETEFLMKRALCLPLHEELSLAQLDYTARMILKFYSGLARAKKCRPI